jgi:lysine N6-hydroxylase
VTGTPPARPDTGTGAHPGETGPYDLVGVGLGPFNLSLAALADGVAGLRTVFFDDRPAFSWHPGLLLDGTTLQVPFLADLVTLVDPTSRWSFLCYLREHDRLFRFYFYERFHVPRREYADYCQWVARSLPSTRFGTRVDAVRWDAATGLFQVEVTGGGRRWCVTARHVVLGIGTEPVVPAGLRDMIGPGFFHGAGYLQHRDLLAGAAHVTVVGSGQSGAEVVADLLRRREHAVAWITRSPAFAPMEYSKIGLEHFTPDYAAYFHGLPAGARDALVGTQDQLYKGISAETITEIYDLLYERSVAGGPVEAVLTPNVEVISAHQADGRILLRCREVAQDRDFTFTTDRVVLATGYAPRRPTMLEPLGELLRADADGRHVVDARFRIAADDRLTGRVYVQNGSLHTHGVGTPDLGLGAWRAAVILNDVTGGRAYRLPPPSAFTRFGAPAGAAPSPAAGAAEPLRLETGRPEPGPAEPGPVESGPVESGPVESGPVEPGPVPAARAATPAGEHR